MEWFKETGGHEVLAEFLVRNKTVLIENISIAR
jgi:hypothetical protein